MVYRDDGQQKAIIITLVSFYLATTEATGKAPASRARHSGLHIDEKDGVFATVACIKHAKV
jgi:hypothetical protein